MTLTEAINTFSTQLREMAEGKLYGSVEAAIRPGNNGPQIILTVKQTIQ